MSSKSRSSHDKFRETVMKPIILSSTGHSSLNVVTPTKIWKVQNPIRKMYQNVTITINIRKQLINSVCFLSFYNNFCLNFSIMTFSLVLNSEPVSLFYTKNRIYVCSTYVIDYLSFTVKFFGLGRKSKKISENMQCT